jgi:hypothetical protein
VTDCAEIAALVEKLADGEASAAERLAAEPHLEKCPSCRSHLEFLVSLEKESRSMQYPEPPPSYWDLLPRKVLDRIDSEKSRPSGFLHRLLAPPVVRWGALGATLLVVSMVGLSLLREDSRAPARELPASRAPSAPPPMARDEAAPEVAPLESLPRTEERDSELQKSPAPAPVPPPAASADSAQAVTLSPDSVLPAQREANVRVLESAGGQLQKAAPAAARTRIGVEDCDALRQAVAALDAAPAPGVLEVQRAREVRTDQLDDSTARFQLALCMLERHEREGTDELRMRAIEDAEAFLAGESEGARAEEIRVKLRRIQPN